MCRSMEKTLHVTFVSVGLSFHSETWDTNFSSFFQTFPIAALRLDLIILLIKVHSVMWIQNINLVKGAWRHPSILTSDSVMLSYLKIFKTGPVVWDNKLCFTEAVTNLLCWDWFWKRGSSWSCGFLQWKVSVDSAE